MRNLRYLLVGILTLFLGIGIINAAELKVTANKVNMTVGSKVNVTVKASGTAGWEYCLSYDTSMFELVSSGADTGGACVKAGSTLTGYGNVTYTLQAKKSGTSKVTVKDYAMYDDAGVSVDTTIGGVTITAKTQSEVEASYSTNDNLKLLDVTDYDISPAFDKSKTEYSLEVGNEVDSINIVATKEDNKASVSGAGKKTLLEGTNKFEIVVTAEKGNKKTYTLTVVRKELNPIKKVVNGKSYSVLRNVDDVETPSFYTLDRTLIDEEEVPAYVSEITGYTLLAMKDEDGNIAFYKYENGNVSEYIQFNMDTISFVLEDSQEKVVGFDIERNITINDVNVKGYGSTEHSEFVLIYGLNVNSGAKGWYVYDIVEKTIQRYNSEVAPVKEEEGNDLYFFLTIVFASISALSILLLIVLNGKNSKLRQNNERLVDILENKKEKREQKIEARFEKLSDRDEEERKKLDATIHLEEREDSKLKNLEEEEQKKEASQKKEFDEKKQEMVEKFDSYDNETEVLEEINNRQEDVSSKKTRERNARQEKSDLLDRVMFDSNGRNKKGNGDDNISKKDVKRIDKQRKHDEKEEIKKMKEDFLSTNEYDIDSDEGK